MGITASNKTLDRLSIDCGGSVKVTLALTAAPDIITNPTDIVLVLDRSGSMAGEPIAEMKAGARQFIDIISESTGGAADGSIGSGSRMAVVSFAGTATADTALTDSVDALKSAVDDIVAGGNTNHAAAFTTALGLFDPASSNAKVIVMFTDGKTTAGGNPAPIAQQAKSEGVIIYCIGLVGTDGIDVATLNLWASDPDSTHVAVTPNPSDIAELFEELAANITKAGATDIRILEKLNDDFRISSMQQPSRGTAEMLDQSTIEWRMDSLGKDEPESALLEFVVRHIGDTSGSREVNAYVDYSDNEGNIVSFPSPAVDVRCPVVVTPEPCPDPVEVEVGGCADFVLVDAGEIELESRGCVIEADVTIKNVCPGRRVALAAVLTELDADGGEHQRGLKTMLIPAHDFENCRDMLVRCIRFVMPEELSLADGSCRGRSFRLRCFANLVDTDFVCCADGN